MSRIIEFANADNLIRRYVAGESENKLAREVGVSRSAFRNLLLKYKVVPRTQSESEFVKWKFMRPESRVSQVAAAHRAAKGRVATIDELTRRATSRERTFSNVSNDEIILATHLRDFGYSVTQQKAVHVYNLDIALDEFSIAVEVFGGGFHAYGSHLIRFFERTKYLLDSGWNVVIVWVDRVRYPMSIGASERVISYVEEFSRDPSIRGQYRVILGNGQNASACESKFNSRSVIERLSCSD